MVVRTSVTEARQGIAAIEQELLTDHFLAQKLYVHQSYKEKKQPTYCIFFLHTMNT